MIPEVSHEANFWYGSFHLTRVTCKKSKKDIFTTANSYTVNQKCKKLTLVRWNEPYQKLASCDTSGLFFVWIKYEGRWSIELFNDRSTPVICFSLISLIDHLPSYLIQTKMIPEVSHEANFWYGSFHLTRVTCKKSKKDICTTANCNTVNQNSKSSRLNWTLNIKEKIRDHELS